MMQYFSDSPTARVINKKFGNLGGEEAGNEASFSYFRYNIDLHPETLKALGFENLTDTKIDDLIRMDQAENRHMLHTIGRQSATTLIEESHSSKAFDVLKIA
jgi:hypothetical protein